MDNLIDLGVMICILFAFFGVCAIINGVLQYFFKLSDRLYELLTRVKEFEDEDSGPW